MCERESDSAIRAVAEAVRLCEAVSASFRSSEAVSKDDRSPVTVADFGAQALIIEALRTRFPSDPVVAEEDAGMLRAGDGAPVLRARVLQAVRQAGSAMTMERLMDLLDAGQSDGGAAGRFWTLDPIDGTKGFIRGDQYAVALALIENGQPVLGVLGCPRLGVHRDGGAGFLYVATRGGGAWRQPVGGGAAVPVRVSERLSLAEAVFCESVEKAHTAQSRSARVAAYLGVEAAPLRMDSQCKYAVVADGEADVYMRFPVLAGYDEKIWDHAAGVLLVEESGGRVTDTQGKALDFSVGRTLSGNAGVLASNGTLHEALLRAVRDERREGGRAS